MNIKKFVLLLFLVMAVICVKAQPGAGDPNGGAKPAPISGIEWLILGGGAFGAIKAYFKVRGGKRGT